MIRGSSSAAWNSCERNSSRNRNFSSHDETRKAPGLLACAAQDIQQQYGDEGEKDQLDQHAFNLTAT